MAKPHPLLKKIRAVCLSLPDTTETMTWGKPHYRVGEKIFAGLGEDEGKPVLGFKLEKATDRNKRLVARMDDETG